MDHHYRRPACCTDLVQALCKVEDSGGTKYKQEHGRWGGGMQREEPRLTLGGEMVGQPAAHALADEERFQSSATKNAAARALGVVQRKCEGHVVVDQLMAGGTSLLHAGWPLPGSHPRSLVFRRSPCRCSCSVALLRFRAISWAFL